MTPAWLLHEVPEGCREVALLNECHQLALARLDEAARVLGDPATARAAARRAGRYELGEEEARALGLAGVALGAGGEFPALSPERWTELAPGEAAEGEIVGLLLGEAEAQAFLRFLAKIHGSGRPLGAAKAAELARHFFFTNPVRAVVRVGT